MRNAAVPFPRYFLIQTTSLCNAGCRICPYVHTKKKLPQGNMDDFLFAKIIDNIVRYKHDVIQVMPYFMNEPLVDQKIVGKIYYIHEKLPMIHSHIVTNGMLLTPAVGEALISSPLTSIKISMLGHRKTTYQATMGVKIYDEVFPRIVEFVEEARERRGSDFVGISCVATPDLMLTDEIEEAREFWAKRDIVYEVLEHPVSRAGNVHEITHRVNTNIKGCASLWWSEMIHILFNGDVILCCMDWRRSIVLGNLRDQSIEEIWHSQRYNEVRAAVYGEAIEGAKFACYHCELAQVVS